ncbi:CDP-glycerol glycerophosphotransferase [Microlunatus elymi]|uniref:CDP-glycerol glycerophosphotransferase n=1 Tax=Microlunatus elymi TaxID=2596828 RepID=A0A516Q0Z4_9ACTN|nr:CDP-glycerol glycerophosphotransferase [Microlunatus elymi]QDP96881.1 CDP-glycerol glycerophosphotransferase [Microlunatus elymi]
MKPQTLLRALVGQAPIAVAIGLALAAIADLRGHGVLGLIAAIGVAGEVEALPLLAVLHGPAQPFAVQLRGYRRPFEVPTGRSGMAIVGGIVLIMVLSMLTLPGWVAFVLMLIAGLGLLINLGLAFRARRGRDTQRTRIKDAVSAHQPAFVIYTGRRNNASYQLAMWIPILEKLQLPYLVVLRHPEALPSTQRVTGAPIVVLPTGSDLDSVIVPGLKIAFYVNGVAENTSFVTYRRLVHVYLGHGDSDKEMSVHPMHRMFDLVFVAGQAAIDRYAQAGLTMPAERFVIVGRPQMAGLQRAGRPIAEASPPTVLFAPTWRGYNAQTVLSSLPLGTKIVSALLDRGATVVFRPHPFSWLGAGERVEINAVDDLLRRDRESTGRPHRMAAEGRDVQLTDDFDACDALITDVGGALVDSFATGKPYAVVLPPGQSADTAATDYPSTAAAYLIEYAAVRGDGQHACTGLLDELLVTDPLRDRRAAVAHYYLGDHPGDDRPFLDAVRALLA